MTKSFTGSYGFYLEGISRMTGYISYLFDIIYLKYLSLTYCVTKTTDILVSFKNLLNTV